MSTSRDSNLDDLFDLERKYDESQEQEGYHYGLELGERDGLKEGYEAGYKHGKERASEIGYYFGFATAWKQFLSLNTPSQADQLSKQILRKIEQLVEMVDCFPRENIESAEEKLTDIRVRFKQVTSMLKIDVANFMYT